MIYVHIYPRLQPGKSGIIIGYVFLFFRCGSISLTNLIPHLNTPSHRHRTSVKPAASPRVAPNRKVLKGKVKEKINYKLLCFSKIWFKKNKNTLQFFFIFKVLTLMYQSQVCGLDTGCSENIVRLEGE